jgi:hypothetical protein
MEFDGVNDYITLTPLTGTKMKLTTSNGDSGELTPVLEPNYSSFFKVKNQGWGASYVSSPDVDWEDAPIGYVYPTPTYSFEAPISPKLMSILTGNDESKWVPFENCLF